MFSHGNVSRICHPKVNKRSTPYPEPYIARYSAEFINELYKGEKLFCKGDISEL